MTGYLRINENYKVGEKYNILHQRICFDDGITTKNGCFYVFPDLQKCIDSVSRNGLSVCVAKVKVLDFGFRNFNDEDGMTIEGVEVLIMEKMDF